MAIAKFKESIAGIEGMFGGARETGKCFPNYLSNINALGAFTVTEQFGLRMGLPQIVHITMPIVHKNKRINWFCKNTCWKWRPMNHLSMI